LHDARECFSAVAGGCESRQLHKLSIDIFVTVVTALMLPTIYSSRIGLLRENQQMCTSSSALTVIEAADCDNSPISGNPDTLAELDPAAPPTGAAQTAAALEFWESERTRPSYPSGGCDTSVLVAAKENYLNVCMKHPHLPVSEMRAQQLARMQEMVELAYNEIPVYRAKYRAAGFSPSDLRTWDDIQKIPVITKPELIAAFPDRCVSARYNPDDLFPTRSSGSSGQTLLIRVNYDAILTDTIQGIR
jgi:phenylacetate-CoA ligase